MSLDKLIDHKTNRKCINTGLDWTGLVDWNTGLDYWTHEKTTAHTHTSNANATLASW